MRRLRKVFSISLILAMSISLFASPAAFAGVNYWAIFNKAESALKAKQYQSALTSYQQALPEFVKRKDQTNTALIYGRMAKCYAELGQYPKAEAQWRLEAAGWAKLGKSQDQLIATRKADALMSEVRLFTTEPGEAAGSYFYHQAPFEPVLGAYIGAYAENDKAVHDPYSAAKRYQTEFPKLTGKTHASYLLYFTYGKDIDSYASHFRKAKETNTAVQLALQPLKGLSEVKQDAWLKDFVTKLDSYGVPVFLRFANEMNEASAPWYGPAKDYIPAYRLVAETVHQNSDNIAMVWAPAWFPPETVDAYYPGDAYVDWVGLSMYKVHNPELDPLGKGVDRESYLKKLERVYNTYAKRKPIFISEGGVSYSDIKKGHDVTPWAVKEIEKFYAYLPMLYPGVKAVYWFDSTKTVEGIPRSYLLSANEAILKAYSAGVQNPFYLEQVGTSSPVYYKGFTGGPLSGASVKMSAWVKTINPDVASVVYVIDGKTAAQVTQMPYTAELALAGLSPGDHQITVKALDAKGVLLAEKAFTFKRSN